MELIIIQMKKKIIIVKYSLTKKQRIIFYFINIINFIYIKKFQTWNLILFFEILELERFKKNIAINYYKNN